MDGGQGGKRGGARVRSGRCRREASAAPGWEGVGCRVGLTWRANGLQVLGRLSGDKYTHVGSLADAILNNYSHRRSHQIPWKTEKELGKEVRKVTWRSEAELGLEEETLAR